MKKQQHHWTDIAGEQQIPKVTGVFNWVYWADVLYRKLGPAPIQLAPREQNPGEACCKKNDTSTARQCKLCEVPICIHCRGLLNGQWICAPCRDEIKARVEFEQSTFRDFPRAFVGGFALAVLAGITWYGIVALTKHVFPLIALVLGIGVGLGVQASVRGKRGFPIQLAAAVTAMLSIMMGRYAITVHLYNLTVNSGGRISVLAPSSMFYFISNLDSFVTGFDCVSLFCAGAIAFVIPRRRVIAVR